MAQLRQDKNNYCSRFFWNKIPWDPQEGPGLRLFIPLYKRIPLLYILCQKKISALTMIFFNILSVFDSSGDVCLIFNVCLILNKEPDNLSCILQSFQKDYNKGYHTRYWKDKGPFVRCVRVCKKERDVCQNWRGVFVWACLLVSEHGLCVTDFAVSPMRVYSNYQRASSKSKHTTVS